MLSGFVRSSAPPYALRLCSAVALFVVAGCGGSSLTGPRDAALVSGPEGRTAGPSGLEHRLTAQVLRTPIGSPYTAELLVTSAVVNTGSAAVLLTARECLFFDADVETSARVDRYEPTISCGAVSSTGNLAPGGSTSTMQVRFGVRSPAGIYTLKLRHALSPEFRGEVTFSVP